MNRLQWQEKLKTKTENHILNTHHKKIQPVSSNPLRSKVLPVMGKISQACSFIWNNRNQLDIQLSRGFMQLEYANKLYCINSNGIQISHSIGEAQSNQSNDLSRDRAQRPYVREISLGDSFFISKSYLNLTTGKPSVTALHSIQNSSGALLGYLCAEFELTNLPYSEAIYDEPVHWKQLKGDPAIRGHLFQQSRIDSKMDQNLNKVMDRLEKLITCHGVFQLNIHFSSSRSTVWFLDSPCKYRLLDIDMLLNDELLLGYPLHNFPQNSKIDEASVGKIFQVLKQLRTNDDVLYLRSASINLFNGLVSFTFSCDGTHYIHYRDLLNPDHHFWK